MPAATDHISSLFPRSNPPTHTSTAHQESLLLRNDLTVSWVAACHCLALEWSPTLPDCRRLLSHIPSEIFGHDPKMICPAECTSMSERAGDKKEKQNGLPLLEGYLLAGCFLAYLAKSHKSWNAKPCMWAPQFKYNNGQIVSFWLDKDWKYLIGKHLTWLKEMS